MLFLVGIQGGLFFWPISWPKLGSKSGTQPNKWDSTVVQGKSRLDVSGRRHSIWRVSYRVTLKMAQHFCYFQLSASIQFSQIPITGFESHRYPTRWWIIHRLDGGTSGENCIGARSSQTWQNGDVLIPSFPCGARRESQDKSRSYLLQTFRHDLFCDLSKVVHVVRWIFQPCLRSNPILES